jgi:hypothetical protein
MKPHFDHKTMLLIALSQQGKTLRQFEQELDKKYLLSQLEQVDTVRQTLKSTMPDGTLRWVDRIKWKNDLWEISTTKHGRIIRFGKTEKAKTLQKTKFNNRPQITLKKRRTI